MYSRAAIEHGPLDSERPMPWLVIQSGKHRGKKLGLPDAEIELLVVAFDDPDGAKKALESLKQIKQNKSILALRNTVVDTAIRYLNEKKKNRARRVNRRRIGVLIAGLIGIAGGLYYLFFHLISGFRL